MVDDFKQVIEQVKLRNPIEDVVRERVSGLRRAGSLWTACCPFHEEKTPSFKVDPRRGTWRCYGACNDGNDVIGFVERAYNVEFREALEILASRAGITLPERPGERAREENDELYAVLARAEKFYRGWLRRPEGAAALAYVRERGLSDATIDAFGVGFAPVGGRELVARAIAQGVSQERLIELGLARADSTGGGRAWDFFQGRLMIPVRDARGRTVGFGARRLNDDDKRAPKYINTPQTPLFHKGRIIYALDAALEHVRAGGHMILVEGYTDVMAAHQVGCRNFVAVLGTATTEDHAALVRKSGARRVSLLFDGDEAGQKATWRALEGLLSLDVKIDVVRLVGDKDPCELLVREGVAPLEEYLANATPWFDFLLEGVRARAGEERWREIDRVLELLARIQRPIVRDELVASLARELDLPLDGVRATLASLPERRRAAEQQRRAAAPAPEPAPAERPGNRKLVQAYRELAAVLLCDSSACAEAAAWFAHCPDAELRRVLECTHAVTEETSHGTDGVRTHDERTVDRVLSRLAGDPAGRLVVPLLDLCVGTENLREQLVDNLRAIEGELHREQILALLSNAQRERALEALAGSAHAAAAPAHSIARHSAPTQSQSETERQLAELHRLLQISLSQSP